MDALNALSESLSALAAQAGQRLFHVPSPLGGRTSLSFDGKLLLVPAMQAEEGESLELLGPGGAAAKATVVGFDAELGLAALELAEPQSAAAWTAETALPPVGSLLLAVAYASPQGIEARLDAVRFSGGEGDDAYIQTDGSPFPGFAGAALVAPSGKLAGFLLRDRGGNKSWAMPAARAAALAAQIAARGFPGKAWLGISTIPVEAPAAFAAHFGDGRSSALMVAGLEKDGPADKAGLLVGDLIVSLAGKSPTDPEELRSVLASVQPKDSLDFVLVRAGERKELKVVAGQAPSSESGGWMRGGRHGGRGHHGWWRGFGGGHHHGHHQHEGHGGDCGCGCGGSGR